MILFKKAKALSKYIYQQKKEGATVGFVPTMGALHKGHLSLIEASVKENNNTVCSIFVNPTQFNNPDDFTYYPATLEKDIELLIASGCQALFLPGKEEIYPDNYLTKKYELGNVETVLEGFYRPGHFQGVCQVMDRLFEIVKPDNLYLGQKDYQQCLVISKLITLLNKQNEIHLHIAPTIREMDGLAMSSRNLRLSAEQRAKAAALFAKLVFVKNNLLNQPFAILKKEATETLHKEGFKVDYFEIADAFTLLPAINTDQAIIALVAAYIDNIRLIDNLALN
ncbi:MAG: pantoate--beta-alanine ligase [Bacteroidota bacterium]|nr:pantoate--beta-alanine ligase [Bacteroidota bacterium]